MITQSPTELNQVRDSLFTLVLAMVDIGKHNDTVLRSALNSAPKHDKNVIIEAVGRINTLIGPR